MLAHDIVNLHMPSTCSCVSVHTN